MPEMSDSTAEAIGRIHARSRKGWLEACETSSPDHEGHIGHVDDDPPQGHEDYADVPTPEREPEKPYRAMEVNSFTDRAKAIRYWRGVLKHGAIWQRERAKRKLEMIGLKIGEKP